MISILTKVFKGKHGLFIPAYKNYTTNNPNESSFYNRVIYPDALKHIEKDFSIVKAKRKDYNKILCLLWQAYFPDEPIMRGLGLGNTFNPNVDELVLNILHENISFMAIDKKTNSIAGAAVNALCRKNSAYHLYQLSKKIEDKKTSHLYELYSFIMTIPQLHKKFELDNIFEVAFLAVHPSFRSKGIATALMKESINFANKQKHYVVRIDATSTQMASICEKLKLLKISDIPYVLYVDENKNPVMTIHDPDNSCQVYVHSTK